MSDAATMPEKGRWLDLLRGQLGVYTLVVNLGVLAFSINNFVVAGIMPTVVADIGGMRLYSWTFALFSVGSVIGAAASGAMSQRLGVRAVNVWGATTFVAGLGLGALAPNMEILVAARFIQGLGGGIMASQSYALIATLFPERLRGHALAFLSTAWGIATALGPAVGGVFAEYGGWRGAFWALTPLALAFIWLAARALPSAESERPRVALPYRRLILMALSVLLLSGTSQSDSHLVRAILVIVAVVLAAITFRRDEASANPMFPTGALRVTTKIGTIYWMLLLNSAVVSFIQIYATLHMQVLHGQAPLVASYLYIALSVGWSASSFVVPSWRGGMETFAIVLGLAIVVVGAVGNAYYVVPGPIEAIVGAMFVLGIGVGFINSPLVQRAIRVVPPAQKHIAASSVQTMRNIGVAFGAAAAGLIAVAAGLVIDAATTEMVASAMVWVYAGSAVLAALTLLLAVPLIGADRKADAA